MIPLSLVSLALLPLSVLASPDQASPIHVPISKRSGTIPVAKLPEIIDNIRLKYGYESKLAKISRRASSAAVPITDELNDSSYSGQVSIGSPAQTFNVILDTGSSDLWLLTTSCQGCGSDEYDPSKSSTFKQSQSTTELDYGSGSVKGTICEDTVTFAGFTINPQIFLAVTQTSQGLLSSGLSGIMGLGFQSISGLQTTPFWAALSNSSQLSASEMSFYLERYVNSANEIDSAPGGVMTLGGTNSSLYQGNIDYQNFPSGSTPSYWLQDVKSMSVNGNSISISDGLAAIDTGTTMIGAPSDVVQSVVKAINGAQMLTGEYQGMFAYPCNTNVNVTLNFGGQTWPVSAADMNLGQLTTGLTRRASSTMCVGGIFDVGSTISGAANSGIPAWIVGDTFLKNVYSVFRANPPSVGFAQLASGLNSNTGSGGSNPATVSGGSLPTTSSSSGSGSSNPFGSGGSNGATTVHAAMGITLLGAIAAGAAMVL